ARRELRVHRRELDRVVPADRRARRARAGARRAAGHSAARVAEASRRRAARLLHDGRARAALPRAARIDAPVARFSPPHGVTGSICGTGPICVAILRCSVAPLLGVAPLRLRCSLPSRLVWLATRPSPPRAERTGRTRTRTPARRRGSVAAALGVGRVGAAGATGARQW